MDLFRKLVAGRNRRFEEARRQRKAILEPVAKLIDAASRPSIAFWPEVRARETPLGASKFGCAPDVPLNFEWPSHNGAPLQFLIQFDLSEIAAVYAFAELPKSGWLYFFHNL